MRPTSTQNFSVSCVGIRGSAPITLVLFVLACILSRRYEAPPCRAATDPPPFTNISAGCARLLDAVELGANRFKLLLVATGGREERTAYPKHYE